MGLQTGDDLFGGTMKLNDLIDAVQYVGSDRPGMNTALYDPVTGEIYIHSEMLGEGTIPEDLDWETCTQIPHPNELELGRNLVFLFVAQRLPEKGDFVTRLFKKRGAYGHFKQLLNTLGLLEAWYEFEDAALRNALRKWCQENEIAIMD
jgi:hypothetical protein